MAQKSSPKSKRRYKPGYIEAYGLCVGVPKEPSDFQLYDAIVQLLETAKNNSTIRGVKDREIFKIMKEYRETEDRMAS